MFEYISVMLKRLKPAFSRGDSKSDEVRNCNLGGYVPISFEQKEARQVTSVPVCVQKMLSLASGRLSNFDKSFLKVHMMSGNGNVCIVRCLDETKVQDVISHVIKHMSDEEKSEPNLYSLMAVCQASDIRYWLHRDMTVSEFHKELCSIHPAPEEWRFELKIRFFFNTLVDLLQTDRYAFFYLFDQVKNNLREQNTYEKLEKELAIVLVSLEIRLMLRERIPKTPNRKVNSMTVDDLDWKKQLPKCFLPDTDAKILSRSMQKALKSCLALSEEECVLKYLNLVSCSWRYFEESYECQFGDPTSTPTVKVIVGPTVGIVYKTVSALIPMTLAKFDKIKSVETLDVGFGQLKITFRNGQSPVVLQCLSKNQNKQLAYLIDGYCVLLKTIAENSFELDYDQGGTCRQSVTSDFQAESQKQASDYAILEETMIDEFPLPAIEDSPDSLPKCTCPEDSSCQSASDVVYIRHSSIFPTSQSNNPCIVTRLTSEVIEEKLKFQKQQSADDAAWLQSAEAKLIIGENNIKSPKKIIDRRDDIFNISINSISKPVESPDNSVDLLQKVKLDRSRDELYCATTALVQSVVDLNCAVQQGQTESLVGSVTRVRVQLEVMINVVLSEVSSLSPQTRLDVELARKTLHSDLQHLINALKMVLPCYPTDLAQDYRRKTLQLGHALALDAKTLFDTIDVARKKMILAQDLATTASTVSAPISKVSHE